MQTTTEITTIFDTTLERAFKTPMLCDITKIHTGHGITPRVTHCTEDETWGKADARPPFFTDTSKALLAAFAERNIRFIPQHLVRAIDPALVM